MKIKRARNALSTSFVDSKNWINFMDSKDTTMSLDFTEYMMEKFNLELNTNVFELMTSTFINSVVRYYFKLKETNQPLAIINNSASDKFSSAILINPNTDEIKLVYHKKDIPAEYNTVIGYDDQFKEYMDDCAANDSAYVFVDTRSMCAVDTGVLATARNFLKRFKNYPIVVLSVSNIVQFYMNNGEISLNIADRIYDRWREDYDDISFIRG